MALYMYILNDCIKVGYSSNFENRKKAYNTHNPMAELIDVFDFGTEEQEKEIHRDLSRDDRFERIDRSEWYRVLDKDTLKEVMEWKIAFWQCVNEDKRYGYIESEYEEDDIDIIPAEEAKRMTNNGIKDSEEYKILRRIIAEKIKKAIGANEYWCRAYAYECNVENTRFNFVVINKIIKELRCKGYSVELKTYGRDTLQINWEE